MDFDTLAAARYSVRKFKTQQVEQEKIDCLLRAARIAPTAGNRQPHRILVITKEAGLKKVDDCTPYRFNAPLVLLTAYDTRRDWTRKYDGQQSGMTDAAIVTTHLMLQAADIGLGSTWVMSFDPRKAVSHFQIPAHLVPAAFLVIGYPADDAVPAEQHRERLALESLVYFDDFSACGSGA
ncbi:MAG: nitroreductase family protein [Spirochaetaceae bacterium]|jgi:nitroreductase|nr:nitroreductase family protein [Spirochaetaceae bacterium]